MTDQVLVQNPGASTPAPSDPDAALAAAFYPHPSSRALEAEVRAAHQRPAATQTPPAPATPGDTTNPPADTTREHAAQVMYGDRFVVDAFDRRSPELFDVLGADAAQRDVLRQDAIEIGRVVPEAVAVKIINLVLDGELAAAHAEDKDAHAAAVNQRIEISNRELRSLFRLKYGRDAEPMLERVRKFARSNPVLAKALQRHGIGSNPDVVTGIADFVFSSGWGA